MIKLILKVIFIGLFLGLLGAASAMLIGLIVFFLVSITQLYLSSSFLKYVSLASVAFGICCTTTWYFYILFLARKYIIFLSNNIFRQE